jgi:ATP-dependent Clp protease ATP-binding subunit ClpA
MFERYTDNLRLVIKIACKGRESRIEEVSDQDILLAIMKVQKSLAGRLLIPCSEKITIGLGETHSSGGVNAREIVQQAVAESQRRRDKHVGTEHLLLAMLRKPGSQSGAALAKQGMDLAEFDKMLDKSRLSLATIFARWPRHLGKTCRDIYFRLRGLA